MEKEIKRVIRGFTSVEHIKDLVENASNVTNLESKKRDDNRSWLRFVCFRLSKDFLSKKEAPLRVIAKAYNRDHATVLNGLKKFEELFNHKDFEHYKKIYKYCYMILHNEYSKGLTNASKCLIETPFEVESYYRLRHISYSKRIRKIFNSMNCKIDKLTKRDVFSQIANLSEEDLDDFEIRANAFLQMKRIKTKKI